MKDQGSTDNWQLQEGKRDDDDRWILRETEQNVSDQWSLQNAPEDEGLEWQPVEYVKPPRRAFAWILPTVIAVALLAVLGYAIVRLLPEVIPGGETPQPAAVAPTEEATEEASPTAAAVAITTEPSVTTTTPAAPLAEETAPAPETVMQEFGTVTSTYGVNARTAPNTDADVIRILPQGESLFVFSQQGDWVEVFVSDTPLVEGQPLSGTIGYAASEFIEIAPREVSAQLVDEVLTYVGRAPVAEPTVEPSAAITTPSPAAGAELTLPTVTPTPEGALPATGALTESATTTGTGTATGTISVTVTVNAVNGVNVRRTPTTDNGNVIRLLENGTVLPAIARSDDGAWIEVLLPDGVTGWIAAEFVQVNGELDSLPLPSTATTTTTTAGPVVSGEVITSGVEPPPPYTSVVPPGNAPAIIVMVPDGVNAREAPDIDARAITVVPRGAVLPAIARSSDSLWVQVELPTGELAWIFRDTVTATPAVGALPAVEVETPTPTPEPPATPAPTATPTPEPAAAGATVRQLLLMVYAEPSSEAETVARAARGSTLDVLGRNTTGDWIQVRDENGNIGWVSANGVAVSVDVTALPVVP